MQIQRSGKATDLFIDELNRLMPKKAEVKDDRETPKEELLELDRKDKGQEAEADNITEIQLSEAGEHKDAPAESTFEGQLAEKRKEKKAAAPNVDVEGITERRLNDASKDLYPHRNPKAHERTGNKRPVNALREEMGNASDEAKRERYEKAYKGQSSEKRVLDEDVGSQKTEKNASFNLKATKTAAIEACKEYIAYKDATIKASKTAGFYDSQLASGNVHAEEEADKFIYGPMSNADDNMIRAELGKRFKDQKFINLVIKMVGQGRATKQPTIAYKNSTNKFAAVKDIDAALTDIMEQAQTEKRALNNDEQAKVMALKIKKSEILKIAGKKKVCDHHSKWEDDGDYEITNDGGECDVCVRNEESKYDQQDPEDTKWQASKTSARRQKLPAAKAGYQTDYDDGPDSGFGRSRRSHSCKDGLCGADDCKTCYGPDAVKNDDDDNGDPDDSGEPSKTAAKKRKMTPSESREFFNDLAHKKEVSEYSEEGRNERNKKMVEKMKAKKDATYNGKLSKTAQPIDVPLDPSVSAPGIEIRKIVSRYEIYEENDQSFGGDPVVEDEDQLNFTPDEYDLEEGLSAAKLAAKYIVQNSGSLEPSSSQFHQGVWYSSTESDMRTGDQIETSFHIVSATPEQEQELYGLITQR